MFAIDAWRADTEYLRPVSTSSEDLSVYRKEEFTKTHDNTVAKALGVVHQAVRIGQEILTHLRSFGLNQFYMLFFTKLLAEFLMDKLAEQPPLLAVLHDEKVITMGNKIIRNVRSWPVTVNGGFLVDKQLD